MQPNQFVVTAVTTGNLDLLTNLWSQSASEKDGEITRAYITERVQYIAGLNKLTPFQSSCYNPKEFLTFQELVKAYDARYLLQSLESDPKEALNYLDHTKDTYIPKLLV